jgi:PiT family inorganic phosphate transporter
MFRLISSFFLGWALGANDSANVFGTAVSSRMIRYSTAVVLTAVFVIIGACIQGRAGLKTLSNLTNQTVSTAFIVSVASAATVTIMTILKLPISTSQSVVGSILGIGIIQNNIHTAGLAKVIICWIGTPVGGFIFGIVLYYCFLFLFRKFRPTIFTADEILRIGLIVAGSYGAYALGANNVANVTGVFSGNLLSSTQAVLFGGISIAAGALTFSKNVMFTVGKSIVKLDAFSALIVVVAHSVTVHIYAIIGVPVSTSQAIVGAVIAIGFIKGIQTINFTTLVKVFGAWVFTPFVGMVFSIIIYLFF